MTCGCFLAGSLGALVNTDDIMKSDKYHEISENFTDWLPLPEG